MGLEEIFMLSQGLNYKVKAPTPSPEASGSGLGERIKFTRLKEVGQVDQRQGFPLHA